MLSEINPLGLENEWLHFVLDFIAVRDYYLPIPRALSPQTIHVASVLFVITM